MSHVTVTGGKAVARWGDKLNEISPTRVGIAASKALNRAGDMGRTQLTKVLVSETGIQYQKVKKEIKTTRARPGRLYYTLDGSGTETNIGLFRATQRKKGVSAAPWNTRRIFTGSFIIKSTNGRVFTRTSQERLPLRALYGPNMAREMEKDEPMMAWEKTALSVVDRRLDYEIGKLFF